KIVQEALAPDRNWADNSRRIPSLTFLDGPARKGRRSMKPLVWSLACLLILALAAESQSQPILIDPFGGFGYGSRVGVRFVYKKRPLHLGGYYYGRGFDYGVAGPLGPGYFGPYPLYGPYEAGRITVVDQPPRAARRPAPPEKDDLAGIDLDKLFPDGRPRVPEVAAKAPDQPRLPAGKPASVFRDVDLENRANALRPPAVPQPPLVAPKPPEPEPEPPFPKGPLADPRAENDRLVQMGRFVFGKQEYGRATQRFRQATQVWRDDPLAYFLLAQAQLARGQYLETVEAIH